MGGGGLRRGQDVPQRHQLPAAVGHLHADGRLAGDGGQDADVGGGHGVGDVLGEGGHPGHLHPRPQLQLVAGHRRADGAADQPGLHPVGGQRLHQGRPGGVDLALVDGLRLQPLEEVGRREPPLPHRRSQLHLELAAGARPGGLLGQGHRVRRSVLHHRPGFGDRHREGDLGDRAHRRVGPRLGWRDHLHTGPGHRPAERVGGVIVGGPRRPALGPAPGRLERPPAGGAHPPGGRPEGHPGQHHQGHHRHRHQDGGRPQPPQTGAERIARQGTQPATGGGQRGRARPDLRRATGQGGQAGHRQEDQDAAQHRPDRLAPGLGRGVPRVAAAGDEQHPGDDGHRGDQEASPAQHVTGGHPGGVADRPQGRPVDGQGGEHPDGEQEDAPQVGGVARHHRAGGGQRSPARRAAAARLRPGAATRALARRGGGAGARPSRGAGLRLRPGGPGPARRSLGGGGHSGTRVLPAPARHGDTPGWNHPCSRAHSTRRGAVGSPEAAAAGQTVTMTGTIMGRCLVLLPTSRPRALRATRLSVSWSWLPLARAFSNAVRTSWRAWSSRASVSSS